MSAVALNPIRGIAMKVISVVFFVIMQTCIKASGPDVHAGQITFIRSAFAVLPILIYLAYTHHLKGVFKTDNPFGHFKRSLFGITSMGCGFYGLTLLPLHDTIAIGYASPLLAVVFAAVLLGEKVRIFRWTAVFVGMIGVLIILWPKLELLRSGGMDAKEGIGAIAVLMGAFLSGLAMVQVRQLVRTEKTPTIVLYFSIIGAALALLTMPFGWDWLDLKQTVLLIASGICGGIAQIFLTESYRHAEVSTVAPFEYSSIILGGIIAYSFFGDIPTLSMLVGTAIVIGAGISIIYREHQLGLQRKAAKKATPLQ